MPLRKPCAHEGAWSRFDGQLTRDGTYFSFFVPGLPHVTLVELRLPPRIILYQDYHMLLLTVAGRHMCAHRGACVKIAGSS